MASINGRAVIARATRVRLSQRQRQQWTLQSRMLACSRQLYFDDDYHFVQKNLDKALLDSGQELRPPWTPQPKTSKEENAGKQHHSSGSKPPRKTETQHVKEEGAEKVSRGKKVYSLKDRLRQKAEGLRNETIETNSPTSNPFGGFIFGQQRTIPMRTRFAPSPTGDMHLGSLRTALVNQVLAKATKGGEFILRIEDTDQSRTVEDSQKTIVQDLEWLGLEWSEGPDVGGPHGPYLQSKRLPIYKDHVEKLIDHGHAYRCFCSSEDLEKQKSDAQTAGGSTQYPGTCRHISPEESSERASKDEPHVVRFKGDQFGILEFKDGVKGRFKKTKVEEDFVILKTDGFPTYHLANVVDDHLMRITHVIRGDEWLVSTPKHLALYQAFGWKPPTFAHLPLLFRRDGKKLSKRDRAASVQTYKETHVEPIALANWLAAISFQRHPEKSILTIQELSQREHIKLLSSNTKVDGSDISNQELDRYSNLAFQKALTDYRSLRDQGRLETIEGQQIKQFLKNTWTPAIELIHTTAAQAKAKDNPEYETHLVEPLRDLAIAPVWTESILNHMAKIHIGNLGRTISRGRNWLRNSVQTSPWLFWRPSIIQHKAWLAQAYRKQEEGQGPVFALRLLRQCYDCEDVVITFNNLVAINNVSRVIENRETYVFGDTPDCISPTVLRKLIFKCTRMMLTGGTASSTPPHPQLIAMLGTEECRSRFRVVEELCQELDAGGEELAARWTTEAALVGVEANWKPSATSDEAGSEEGASHNDD